MPGRAFVATALDWSADGRLLAAVGPAGLAVWDVGGPAAVLVRTGALAAAARLVRVAPSADVVALVDADGRVDVVAVDPAAPV